MRPALSKPKNALALEIFVAGRGEVFARLITLRLVLALIVLGEPTLVFDLDFDLVLAIGECLVIAEQFN